ncbi:hypothetical protein [Pseudanabaena sp. FACHB-2040]|uniref:hypothetical protein n=1 Tax=Pseudanabaena sp. FACHB-2040 TaxID=2692859 RepID=UPI00168342B9|nr:hypothetical protein [Pseudanabaena sp. FACHB-2040]MBD0269999.1 hypothetical protein [Cyanobacteria bacterium Co-bin8]MBD2257773.1 hypothetical protein [Pseudanabaena sp. FACHB-2040]
MRTRPQRSILFRLATHLLLYAILTLFGLTLFAGLSTIFAGQVLVEWLAYWVGFGIWRVAIVILCLLAGGVLAESLR